MRIKALLSFGLGSLLILVLLQATPAFAQTTTPVPAQCGKTGQVCCSFPRRLCEDFFDEPKHFDKENQQVDILNEILWGKPRECRCIPSSWKVERMTKFCIQGHTEDPACKACTDSQGIPTAV
jgi:hypothetical protein